MGVKDSSTIFHKISKATGGWPKIDISRECFCVLCFVFGVLFSYVFTTDRNTEQPYPVNNMTLRDIAVLVDMEARTAAAQGHCYEELAAISAMQMVNVMVSEYRMEAAKDVSFDRKLKGIRAWHSSAGDCYAKVYVMMEILNNLHIPAREINYWHIDGTSVGYAACETYYNDSWHYFDPTWGLYFKDSNKKILSLQRVLDLPKEGAYSCFAMNAANMQNTLYDYRSSMQNIIEKEAQITVAGNSNIIFDFKKNNSLSYIPTQIGILKNRSGEKCEAKYTIVFDENMKEINIYYTNIDKLDQIELLDEKGNLIDRVQINEHDGVIAIKQMLSSGIVTLQAHNPDKFGWVEIEGIEGIYNDGSKVHARKEL